MTSSFLLLGTAALEDIIKLIKFAAATLQYRVWDSETGNGELCMR